MAFGDRGRRLEGLYGLLELPHLPLRHERRVDHPSLSEAATAIVRVGRPESVRVEVGEMRLGLKPLESLVCELAKPQKRKPSVTE